MYLRECLSAMGRDKKFKDFRSSEGYEEIEDYLEVIKQPMNLELMMDKLNSGMYDRLEQVVY